MSGVRRIRRRRHPADWSGDPSRMRRTGSRPGRPLLTPWPSRDGGRPYAARFERCADDAWPSPTHDRRVTNAFDSERDHRRPGPFDFNPCAAYSRRWDCAQVNLCQAADGLRQAWTAAYGLARRAVMPTRLIFVKSDGSPCRTRRGEGGGPPVLLAFISCDAEAASAVGVGSRRGVGRKNWRLFGAAALFSEAAE